jgi:hypothetical protein
VKVLSMIQPWASLLVLREMQYETRTWRTKYRGPLAIHASQRIKKSSCREEPFRSLLEKHGYSENNLPTGVILATCRLENCWKIVDVTDIGAILEDGKVITGPEYEIGGFMAGEFVWQVLDMRMLPTPIPALGKLGLWEHPVQA